MMHLTFGNDSSSYEDVHYSQDHSLRSKSFSLATGFYKAFGHIGRSEQYAGMAYGKAENKYTYSSYKQTSEDIGSYNYSFTESRTFYQYFFQNNIGFVTPRTEGALIARLSYVHFTNQHFEQDYQTEAYKMVSDNFVFQPGMKIGYGSKSLRLQLQCGWNIPLTSGSDLKWYSAKVEAGIVLRIGE